ncbi:hypothetical protein D3C76_1410460 [compost metagenome]
MVARPVFFCDINFVALTKIDFWCKGVVERVPCAFPTRPLKANVNSNDHSRVRIYHDIQNWATDEPISIYPMNKVYVGNRRVYFIPMARSG